MTKFTDEQVLNQPELDVQFLDEHEEALFTEARLGEDARTFLESELGRLLRGRATLDIQDAQAALLNVAPENTALIRELQFKAAVARRFVSWVVEAVNNGDDAYEQLKQLR